MARSIFRVTQAEVRIWAGWTAIMAGAAWIHPGAGLIAAGYFMISWQRGKAIRKLEAAREAKRGATH